MPTLALDLSRHAIFVSSAGDEDFQILYLLDESAEITDETLPRAFFAFVQGI